MTLRQTQTLFVQLLGKLIDFTYSSGYELTLGDGWRADGQGHMKGSLHYIRLAQDLNLFVGGVYITSDHPAWHKLGTYWTSLHPLCRWGGNFTAKDYNHFSLTYGGKE